MSDKPTRMPPGDDPRAGHEIPSLLGGRPGRDTCLLCGEPLPKAHWWARITGTVPPTHNPNGAEGDACWAGFNKRMGIENPGPKPKR